MRYWSLLLPLIVLLAGCAAVRSAQTPAADPAPPAGARPVPGAIDHMVVYKTKDSFEFVRDLIKQAIADRGLKVNNVSHIGDMLERTGKDVGDATRIYLKAEALEFCSATVSRRMMEADPHNIVFCPYIIAVYVLPQEPDTVYVAYRRPQPVGSAESRKALKAVEKLLDGIVREAIGT